jgi:hypothetical protein
MNMRWMSIAAAVIVLSACFFPWIHIESKDIIVSGVSAEGTSYGKPGYMHFILAGFFLMFMLFNKTWAQRAAVFLAAFNLAWAIRNYIVISSCHGGECPQKQVALYAALIFSVLMLLFSLLVKLPAKASEELVEEID